MSHQLPDKFRCIHLDDTYEIPRGLTTEFDPEPVTIGEVFPPLPSPLSSLDVHRGYQEMG